jgi:ketosteroid isomerase-like protein
MRYLAVTLLLFASLAIAQTGTTAKPPAAGKQPAGVVALRDAYVAAFNAKQADKVAALYAQNAVLLTPQGTLDGREAIRGQAQKDFDQGISDLHVVSTKSGGDATNQWEAGDFSQKSKTGEMKGRYLVNLKMTGGKWMIVSLATVPTLPPQPQR